MSDGGSGNRRQGGRVASVECGLLKVTGRDAVDLLHRLSTNDLRPLAEPGNAAATVFVTPHGKMLDWCFAMRTAAALWLETSPGRAARVQEWIGRYTILEDVRVEDLSAAYRHLVVRGPTAGATGIPEVPAGKAVAVGGGVWRRSLEVYGAGADGVVPVADAAAVLARAVASGATQASPAELEIERIDAGVPSPFAEFAGEINPLELRLGPVAVSFTKGCYVGQEVISRIDSYDKLARVLTGFAAPASSVPGVAADVLLGGQPVGKVTSAVKGGAGRVTGLAVVRRERAAAAEVELVWAGGRTPARLEERGFWKT
ncbi:MAG: hypothetical protein HY903_24040 [Deltaproteobacteria bacterium]|nr:hypothetical protein [Deltaproteobacteria bacterium]